MQWTDSSTELLRRAVAGEQAALAALLTEAEPDLRRRISPRVPGDMRGVIDADDVLQEVYAEAFRSVARFEDRGPGSFERWLATIAMRCLRGEIRRQRSAKRGGGWGRVHHVGGGDESAVTLLRLIESSESTPSRQVARWEARDALAAVLETLPAGCADVVQLVYFEGCTVAEAAERLGRTERAVHSLCYRAKVALRTTLGADRSASENL